MAKYVDKYFFREVGMFPWKSFLKSKEINPLTLSIVAVISIFFAEFVIMFTIEFFGNHSPLQETLFSSLILICSVIPMIYLVFYLPMNIQLLKTKKIEQIMTNLNISQQVLIKTAQKHKTEKEQIFRVYKDVIFSITQGKLVLLTRKEFESLRSTLDTVRSVKIEIKEDVNKARTLVQSFCIESQVDKNKLNGIILATSEAVTNVIKHANRGILDIAVDKDKEKILLIIKDEGLGMELALIPQMIFIKGFSTKQSLGFGYNVLYNNTDRIHLCTSEKGTALILEFFINNH